MHTIHLKLRTNLRHFALACLLPTIAIGAAHAESASQAQATYQKERSDCLNGQTAESKKTCLREAGAALNDAKNGRLDKYNTNFEANAMARCQVFKNEEDRGLCERRQREGTTTGSVGGGGDIRELTVRTVEEAPPEMPQPTSNAQQSNPAPSGDMPQNVK